MARIDGIDISHWQSGTLDFHQAARAGVRFVAHKATEATNYRDPFHDRRRSEVGAAGLVFGSYHFARPGASSGRQQAAYFLATAKPTRGDLHPILDLEDRGGLSAGSLTRWVRDFVHEVQAQTGVLPIIYTNFDLNDHFDCPRWAARYSNAMNPPNPARPWSTWTIWQFSNGVYGHPATVPGIGACDINTLNTSDPAILLEQLVIGGRAARTVPEEDDMEWSDWSEKSREQAKREIVRELLDHKITGDGLTFVQAVRRAAKAAKVLEALNDLPDRIEVNLPTTSTLTRSDVRKAVAGAVREVLGSLDEEK